MTLEELRRTLPDYSPLDRERLACIDAAILEIDRLAQLSLGSRGIAYGSGDLVSVDGPAYALAAKLYREFNFAEPCPTPSTRPVTCLVSRANYGHVSGLLMEFQGSAPRCTVAAYMLGYGPDGGREISVAGRRLRRRSARMHRVSAWIDAFLSEAGYDHKR